MSWMLSLSEAIAGHLWSISWQVSILIGVIWIIDRLSFRASSLFRYWLWCIVPVRLCIPASVGLPLGWTRAIMPDTVDGTIMTMMAPDAFTGIYSAIAPLKDSLSLLYTVGIIWMFSVALIGLVILVRMVKLGNKLRDGIPVLRPELITLFARLQRQMGIARTVGLHVACPSMVELPAASGVFRPRILLPSSMIETWSLKDIQPVLLHELAHIKRNDLAVNWLQIVVQALFFFHPLVWFANYRIRQIREERCDDIVISMLGTNWKNYLVSILRVMEDTVKKPALGYIRVGLFMKRNQLKERIERVMTSHYTSNQNITVRSAITLTILVLMSFSIVSAKDKDSIINKDGVVLTRIENAADEFSIGGNYPNPVSAKSKKTTFVFTIPENNPVVFVVYDSDGFVVDTLIDKKLKEGKYKLEWNIESLSSGLYFYRLQSGADGVVFQRIKKMTVIQ